MKNFTFYTPTKVFFGKDTHLNVGGIIKSYGYRRILLHYGGQSLRTYGVYDAIISSLNEYGIAYVELGGVEPNPKLSLIREGIALCRRENIELVLAAGGGSAIDSAKEIAIGALTDTDTWTFCRKEAVPTAALPVGVVLTIAAAGSEMSASAVVSHDELKEKRGYNSDFHRPLFSILNPELTYTLPPFQTSCGIVDIMMHTIDRFLSNDAPCSLPDGIGLALLRSVIAAGSTAMNSPRDYEARATLMWAGSLSHNDLTGAGRDCMLNVHQFEHAISGIYDHVAHAAGLSVMLPAYMKYLYRHKSSRYALLAREAFYITAQSDEEAAREGICAVERYFKSLDMPLCFADLDIPAPDIDALVSACSYGGTRKLNCDIPVGESEMREIFMLAVR